MDHYRLQLFITISKFEPKLKNCAATGATCTPETLKPKLRLCVARKVNGSKIHLSAIAYVCYSIPWLEKVEIPQQPPGASHARGTEFLPRMTGIRAAGQKFRDFARREFARAALLDSRGPKSLAATRLPGEAYFC